MKNWEINQKLADKLGYFIALSTDTISVSSPTALELCRADGSVAARVGLYGDENNYGWYDWEDVLAELYTGRYSEVNFAGELYTAMKLAQKYLLRNGDSTLYIYPESDGGWSAVFKSGRIPKISGFSEENLTLALCDLMLHVYGDVNENSTENTE